jgi:hypothetical protein
MFFRFRAWLRALAAALRPGSGSRWGRRKLPPRPVLYRRRLHAEQLEEIVVPATVTWDGGAGTFKWSDAANWSGDTLPGTADDVSIPDLPGTPTITSSGAVSIHSLSSVENVTLSGGVTFTVATTLSGPGTYTLAGVNLYQATVTAGTQLIAGNGNSGLDAVTLDGDITVSNGIGITVQDGLTLNGTMTLGDAAGSTYGRVAFYGTQSLLGTGTVVFAGPNANNSLHINYPGPP